VKRFAAILKRYNIVVEDANQPNPNPMGDVSSALPGAPTAPAADAPETIDNQTPPEPAVKQLQPENYVLLVKLLKAAFIASPSEEDAATVNNLKFTSPDGGETEEVNETNADEAFNKLLPILSKYINQDKTVAGLLKTV